MTHSPLEQELAHGFIDGHRAHRTGLTQTLFDNQRSFTMSRAIITELRHADMFVFSVAFIRPSEINALKRRLLDFQGTGTTITSNYLGLNSPATYLELLNFPNLKVKGGAEYGFHAIGTFSEVRRTVSQESVPIDGTDRLSSISAFVGTTLRQILDAACGSLPLADSNVGERSETT